MTTRVLKVDDEDLELISKIITNIHKNLMENPVHPVYSPYLLSAQRLFDQIEDGLPTEKQYIKELNDAETGFTKAERQAKEAKAARRKAQLEKEGIKTRSRAKPKSRPKATASNAQNDSTPSSKTSAKKTRKPVKKRAATKPSKPKVSGPCKVHNNSGARSPRSDCKGCWSYYKELHPDRYDAAWKRFKESK